MMKLTKLAPLALLAFAGAGAVTPWGFSAASAQSCDGPCDPSSSYYNPSDPSNPSNPSDPSAPPPPPGGGGPGSPGGSYDPGPLTFSKGDEVKKALISCRTATAKTELWFRNIGNAIIKAGTPITWQVKETGERGIFSLSTDLKPGGYLSAADLLKSGMPADAHCLSRIG